MIRLILALVGNLVLIPFNLALLVPRMLFKIVFNYKATRWTTVS